VPKNLAMSRYVESLLERARLHQKRQELLIVLMDGSYRIEGSQLSASLVRSLLATPSQSGDSIGEPEPHRGDRSDPN
jgi:hypothetical protein